MMKIAAAFSLMVALLVISAADCRAEDKKWQNETELSYVQTGGNTDVTTLSFNNLLNYQFNERVKSAWKLGLLYGQSDGTRTAETYMTELRADYKLKEKLYLYGLGGYMTDEFSGMDHRSYGGLGAGYLFMDGPKHHLSSELGLNYASEAYIDDTEDSSIEGRAFSLYEYTINERSRFSQRLEYLYDFNDNENYRINSSTDIKVRINTILSLKVGYEVRYDNAPSPKTLNDTDTRFYTAIVATLK